ncbi:MAG: LLM class flavin-dependent oxidoreductase [Actinomycetota bacterium]
MAMEIGAPGTIMPPVEGVLKTAMRNEQKGYDALWWPDHLMGWHPDSIWTPDVTPLANFQSNPHIYFDPVACIAAAATHTERIRLGTSVTEPVRRHPAMLANEWLTLDHFSKGRAILGIGAGEGENNVPYGMDFSTPASRFEEALTIIRLLWENNEPLDFDGDVWTMRRAVCGMSPYTPGVFPLIWTGAHGPRMLEITGRLADGWLPTRMSPAEYASRLGTIRAAAEKAGRDFSAFTPGLWAYTVIASDHEESHRILNETLPKGFQLVLPSEEYEKRGYSHPLGTKFQGLRDYIPTHLAKDEALKAIGAIPDEISHDFTLHGTPDDIVAELRDFEAVGVRHAVLWNITFLGDATKIRESYHLLDDVLAQVKGGSVS